MEKTITTTNQYDSLDKLYDTLKSNSFYECTKTYDIWELRTDANGQMQQCVLLKKSAMHAIKLYLTDKNEVKINYIIPNKTMNALFGKSVKARRDIFEIVTGKIKEAILAPAQKKAFEELEESVSRTL